MNFKIVSTGAKVSNLNEDPKLRVYPETSRFKLNAKAVALLTAVAGMSVTLLADVESKIIAVFKSIPKTDAKGNVLMKDIKLSEAQREEMTAEGIDIPQEPDYENGCKLGKHFEFSSAIAIAETGITETLVCNLAGVESADVLAGVSGLDHKKVESNVLIFSYGDAVTEEVEEEVEEESEEEESEEDEE